MRHDGPLEYGQRAGAYFFLFGACVSADAASVSASALVGCLPASTFAAMVATLPLVRSP